MTDAEVEALLYLSRSKEYRRRVTFADFLHARHWDFTDEMEEEK